MGCLRLLIAGVLAAGVACAANNVLASNILIQIDKPSQTMTVAVDGQVQYRWPVSTGATGFSTPTGSYTPFRMEVMHYSREWDNAGMPHAIFFTKRGHSIHGSDHPGLGTAVSHGCVRLSLPNAVTLYQLVQADGMANTRVVVRGSDPPGYRAPTLPPTQRQPWRPFQFFASRVSYGAAVFGGRGFFSEEAQASSAASDFAMPRPNLRQLRAKSA